MKNKLMIFLLSLGSLLPSLYAGFISTEYGTPEFGETVAKVDPTILAIGKQIEECARLNEDIKKTVAEIRRQGDELRNLSSITKRKQRKQLEAEITHLGEKLQNLVKQKDENGCL